MEAEKKSGPKDQFVVEQSGVIAGAVASVVIKDEDEDFGQSTLSDLETYATRK